MLHLEFGGEEREVRPDQTLTFGRSADLVIDARNRHLHRVLGCFVAEDDVWFLQNLGRFTPLDVEDAAGSAGFVVAPGDQAPVGFAEFRVVFGAGSSEYRIRGTTTGAAGSELA